jgi:peptide/nickel transport system permease protein/oligopeptide transport system permease protein
MVRLAQVPLTLLGVVTTTFILLRVMPGDPVSAYLGEIADAAAVAMTKTKFGLDKPIYVQYFNTVKGIVSGDLGRSFESGRSVLWEIGFALPNTLILAGGGLLVSSVLGISAGIVAALKRNRFIDYLVMTLSTLGVSMPIFWFGLLLLLVFSIHLGVFPVSGVAAEDNVLAQLHALVLPAFTVGLMMMAITARMTRASMVEVLYADFITLVRAKGASEAIVVYKHALKNAMIPIVTVIGLNAGLLVTGAVLTETVFARPGIGKLLVDAVLAKDYPLVEGLVLLIGFTYIFTNLVVDILYAYLDPRIKYK